MAHPTPDTVTQTAQHAVCLLRQKGLQVATAESCTAGLLSAAITSVSGASAVFGCGVAAYAPETKRDVLNVPADILAMHGTVSRETATHMADGVRRLANADVGIAITGVAGPDPSEGKPVGTVHIALANEQRVWLRLLEPCAELVDREAIRQAAICTALDMLVAYTEAYPALIAGSTPLAPLKPAEVVIPENPTVNERRFLSTVLPWRGDTLKERILKITAIATVACLLIGCLLFAGKLATERTNRSLYSDLQNIYTAEQEAVIDQQSDILPRFSSLYLQNADIGGWIRIDNTAINYPVMKNAGSDYYDTHNFHQQDSVYGVPYFDSHNALVSPNEHNKVLIIYGNNTRDGQMFSELTAYRDADFFKQHMTVDMSTLYASDRWLLFGAFVLDPEEINAFDYTKTTFQNDAEFTSYVTNIRKRSLVNTDVKVDTKDDLLLMVTDAEKEYGFEGAILVVAGRRLRDGETPLDIEETDVSANRTVLMPRVWVHLHRDFPTTKTTRTADDAMHTTRTASTSKPTTARTTKSTKNTTKTTKSTPKTTASTTAPTTESITATTSPTDAETIAE